MFNHLEEKSIRCRIDVRNTFNKLPQGIAAELDARDAADARQLARKGRRRHHSESFVVRMQGPLSWAAEVASLSHKSLLKTGPVMLDDATIDLIRTARTQ